jgi:hypothetical protein
MLYQARLQAHVHAQGQAAVGGLSQHTHRSSRTQSRQDPAGPAPAPGADGTSSTRTRSAPSCTRGCSRPVRPSTAAVCRSQRRRRSVRRWRRRGSSSD